MQKYKILSVSDEEILKRFSLEQLKEKFGDVDFILSAGDVSNEYLDYLFTALNKDLIYVNGNHVYQRNHNISFCKCIDGKIIKYKKIVIAGFDGSMAYSFASHQYTEFEMTKIFLKNILWFLIRKPDIVLSHSPPYKIHDADDLPHRGFKIFVFIINYFSPKIWIHGHTHLKNHMEIQESIVNKTKIVNTYGYKILDIDI